MSVIKFIQIGGTVYRGTPALLLVVERAKIPYAISFMYIKESDMQDMETMYGYHEWATIIMVHPKKMRATAEALANVAKKAKKKIVIIASTKASRDFNLGVAVGTHAALSSGTYIASGGQVMEWDRFPW